jgi:hypothetical protein
MTHLQSSVVPFLHGFPVETGARKDLLPHAAAEPIYWSKPFELELFTLLEVCGAWG